MRQKILITVAACLMALVATAQNEGPTWESLNQRPYPQWFGDAKLGIFIHWGLYSVPAYAGKEGYGEWFYRGLMAGVDGRKRIMSYYADTTLGVREMYGQLTNHWHAELWQPQEWARMFREAGARYVVLVTKHHDGYCLWDSPQQPDWNSTVSGPRRNIVGELTDAVRAEGMKMGFYFSLPEWSNPLHRWTADPDSTFGCYADQYMVPQFKELVGRYRPELIFSDGDWDFTPEQLHSVELIDWYYRTVGDEAIVNDRWGRSVNGADGVPGSGTRHGFRTPEYSAGIADTSRPWAECRGMGRSFGLNRNEDLAGYLTDRELIQHFCELVAHGGGLTLNVGPYADGTIPLIQQERLQAMGRWLAVNGEAIYGSRPWTVPCQREQSHAKMPDTKVIDYNWVRNAPLKGMPVDRFDVRWQGIVYAPQSGDYTLRVEGDDEMWVVHDGDTLLYHNHAWADNSRSQTTMHLDKGESLALEVILREKEMEATAHLDWSLDGGATYSAVPAQWHGEVTWDRTSRCFTRQGNDWYIIEFDRPGQQVEIDGLPQLPKGTTIRLLGTSTPARWHQRRNGRLNIDLSSLDHAELNALENAWVFKVSR